MARSNYVYVVLENAYEGDDVIAGFTVKHELISWLRRHPEVTCGSWQVIRLRDGAWCDLGEKHSVVHDMTAEVEAVLVSEVQV